MRNAIFASFIICLFPSLDAMAASPLPNSPTSKIITPVCVVSGLPEVQLQALQKLMCAEASSLLSERRLNVEALALNDPRLGTPGRLVVGIRGHVEEIGDNNTTVITIAIEVTGAQRIIPTAAHATPFEAGQPVSNALIRAALSKCLQEQGLL